MTKEMFEHCKTELEDAVASGDNPRIKAAECRILTGIMECQYKTSERVKGIVCDIAKIMQDHDAMVQSHKQYQNDRAERRGAKKVFAIIKWGLAILSSGGAGAGVLKIIQSLN